MRLNNFGISAFFCIFLYFSVFSSGFRLRHYFICRNWALAVSVYEPCTNRISHCLLFMFMQFNVAIGTYEIFLATCVWGAACPCPYSCPCRLHLRHPIAFAAATCALAQYQSQIVCETLSAVAKSNNQRKRVEIKQTKINAAKLFEQNYIKIDRNWIWVWWDLRHS